MIGLWSLLVKKLKGYKCVLVPLAFHLLPSPPFLSSHDKYVNPSPSRRAMEKCLVYIWGQKANFGCFFDGDLVNSRPS